MFHGVNQKVHKDDPEAREGRKVYITIIWGLLFVIPPLILLMTRFEKIGMLILTIMVGIIAAFDINYIFRK